MGVDCHTVNGYGDLGVNYLIFHNKYTGGTKSFLLFGARTSEFTEYSNVEIAF